MPAGTSVMPSAGCRISTGAPQAVQKWRWLASVRFQTPSLSAPFFTFTFGLLDGWWAYEDEQDRLPHAPVTSAEGWHRLLHKVGFASTRAFGLPHQRELNRQTQSVIIAESTGTYRAENIPQAPAAAVKAVDPAPRASEPVAAGPAQVEEIITGLLATSLGAADFAKDVFPVLEKAGCSGCHNVDGVASGTRLKFPESPASPEAVNAFGRSLGLLVNKSAPEKSLLIQKPTKTVPHAGGRRIQPGSADEAKLRTMLPN